MEDYEIRDALRRATTPELFVTLSIGGDRKFVAYAPNNTSSRPVTLSVLIGNRSPQPAYYTNLLIGIDDDLAIVSFHDFQQVAPPSSFTGSKRKWFAKRFSSDQPIFQEADANFSAMTMQFALSSHQLVGKLFRITTIVQTPGFSATEHWVMICDGGYLTLYDPNHRQSRAAGTR